MNGPVKMFRTRQIVRHDLKVSLPNCMYKLKNIHASNDRTGPEGDHVAPSSKSVDISEQVKQFLKNLQHLPEMSALIDRQQKILKQLDELRQQMITLKTDLSTSDTPVTTNSIPSSFICPIKIDKVPNIIINASPTHPPYSLLLVKKLFGTCIQLHVTVHLHSTVSNLPEKAEHFLNSLCSNNLSGKGPEIKVRLIWKDVGPNTELIISQTPIIGEVNILRYLARLVPEQLIYETVLNCYEINSVLDICHRLGRSTTKTERSSLLQSLNKSLGKSEWLCNSSKITIADIAAYSVIKQVASNEITQNMNKWLQKCEVLVT